MAFINYSKYLIAAFVALCLNLSTVSSAHAEPQYTVNIRWCSSYAGCSNAQVGLWPQRATVYPFYAPIFAGPPMYPYAVQSITQTATSPGYYSQASGNLNVGVAVNFTDGYTGYVTLSGNTTSGIARLDSWFPGLVGTYTTIRNY